MGRSKATLGAALRATLDTASRSGCHRPDPSRRLFMTALERCDLLLTGGTVIDGTGARRRRADVAIVDDRIAAVGDLTGVAAGRTVDATGKIVAPGFIDVHTHDDRALLDRKSVV